MLLRLEARNYIKVLIFFRFFVKICKVRLCKERVQTGRRNKVQEKRGFSEWLGALGLGKAILI